MSSVVVKKRYTSVMEKIIKNAVSETTKVLETVIAELQAEVLRVTNENENLKIRCSQFEEVVKKRSVYRETGTSPDPWIIEKCDKAVQFDFVLHNLDDDDDSPNISENEAQSESSFGPIYEKDTSNDSISFSRTTDTQDNSCTPPDLVNETMTEKTVADYGKNESVNSQLCPDTESKATDTCYEPSEMKTQEDVCLKYSETDQSLMECQETTQQEQSEKESCPFQEDVYINYIETDKSPLKCQETIWKEQNEYENLSFQEDNCIKHAETDQSLLECQETTQHKQNEKENIPYPEDMFASTDITCEESNAHSKDCEHSLLLAPSPESACTSNALTQPEEETSQMDVDMDRTTLSPSELKTENSSTADLTDGKFDQNVEQVETVTCSKDRNTSESTTESDQTCARNDDTEGQSMSLKNIHAKEARNSSHSLSPPKSQYFLRRQRCSSVTLEDAMLLLDAVSQQKYKSSPPKKIHSTESFKNVPTPKPVNIPEVLANLEHQSEEFTLTTESLQPHAINSSVTMEAADTVNPTSIDIHNQQGLETIWSSKPSWPEETVIQHDVPASTPIKGKECLVTEADSAGLNIEGQQDHQKIFSSSTESLVSLVTENPTPNLTPTKLDETMHVTDQTENIVIDEDEKTATSSTQQSRVEHSFETSVPQENEAKQVELPSPIDLSASNASEETLSNPILQTPFETLINNEQISCSPIHDSSEFQENDLQTTIFATQESSPLLNPPAQQTMVLKLSGDVGDQTSSVVKSITSPSTLSPAQLSAVVSAVRSTQMRASPTPSVATPSSKKGLVAVPFSLQSVMRPHHKIIVIPRQCKAPPSPQAVVKDKMVVMKHRAFEAEATTTFISTTDVNQETTSGESLTMEQVNSMDQQHAASVDTSTSFIEPSSTSPNKSPCTNTVQIKLNRISFPVTSTDSVSVTDMPENPEPQIIVRKRRGRPPSKRKNLAIDSNQITDQPNKDSSHSPLTGSSPALSSNETAQITSSSEQNIISAEENQPPPPEQLFPVVAKDHSYPQHCMTKSQFLAKLEVSPVTEISKKAVSLDKVAQKASLVDRLRSHLKPHMRTVKRPHKPEIRPDDSKLIVETENPTYSPTQEITRPNQDKQNENLLDAVPHNENNNASPKTPPSRRNVPNKAQVKRKRSPKRNMTPTKTVKRRNLKKTTKPPSTENIPARKSPISPMHNKIMNSNALLSCVRKGIKKKSFLCKFCRKEFAKKKDIEIHIQVHVGKKPFQCNICHRRFSRTMELSRHLKRHNAEKKYQCTSCGKAFIEYNNLKRHSYIHTGEKPFACPHCNRSFTQSGHMRAHIKNKHKDIKA